MQYIRTAAGVLSVMLLFSCEKDFDKINQDPNGVTDVPADFLLPGAIMSISNAENGFMESFAYASDWVQYTSGGFWADPGRYHFERSRSFMWDNLYSGPLIDLKVMNRKAIQEGNMTLRAVSLVMYCYGFALLADCYGPVPFSQALAAEEGINKPEYDTQEQVYLALLDSLATASHLLTGVDRISIRSGYDVMFNGDGVKWLKFANALRLRILMRISATMEVSVLLSELIADPDLPLPQSNSDDAKFLYSAASVRTWHPLYDVLSAEASDGGFRLSKTLTDHLLSTNDPRLPVYGVQNSSGDFAGLPTGSGATAGQIDQYSRVNPRYGQKERPGVFISYSEVMFLLAEAAARNLIDGDPEIWYNEAIRANFMALDLSDDQFNAFIESPQGRYTNLERIAQQKWVSLFGRGLEGWTEYRRTQLPQLTPAAFALVDVIPHRFLYPLSEEQTNQDNLAKAILMLANGDALNSAMWWMN